MLDFEDRVVEHPLRFKLVPVAGTTDEYDLVPVPGKITSIGRALNKEYFDSIKKDIENWKIENASITTEKLANNAVSTEKIADGAITPEKLGENVTAVTSSYVGNGGYDDGRIINCGFKPKLVIIRASAYGEEGMGEEPHCNDEIIHNLFTIVFGNDYEAGFSFEICGYSLDQYAMNTEEYVQITDVGFSVGYEHNYEGVTYHYIAFR